MSFDSIRFRVRGEPILINFQQVIKQAVLDQMKHPLNEADLTSLSTAYAKGLYLGLQHYMECTGPKDT